MLHHFKLSRGRCTLLQNFFCFQLLCVSLSFSLQWFFKYVDAGRHSDAGCMRSNRLTAFSVELHQVTQQTMYTAMTLHTHPTVVSRLMLVSTRARPIPKDVSDAAAVKATRQLTGHRR